MAKKKASMGELRRTLSDIGEKSKEKRKKIAKSARMSMEQAEKEIKKNRRGKK